MGELAKDKAGKPCLYAAKGKDGKAVLVPPAVDCSFDCDSCGWNPVEIRRRWADGLITDDDGIRGLKAKRRTHNENVQIPVG
jgi:hypothetical protein